MTTRYSKVLITDLLRGGLSPSEIEEMQRREKDLDRFEKVLRVEQERLGWSDRILVCLQEHLYVVEKSDESRVVRCDCGHEFGDYRRNWKETALVYERDPRDGRVYRGPRAADPDWHVLREFYCPGCVAQLDVEMVPKGYPFIFNFIPDIEGHRGRSEDSG